MASKWTANFIGFNNDTETNLNEVDFLDVTRNLQNGIYRSYKKPN